MDAERNKREARKNEWYLELYPPVFLEVVGS